MIHSLDNPPTHMHAVTCNVINSLVSMHVHKSIEGNLKI